MRVLLFILLIVTGFGCRRDPYCPSNIDLGEILLGDSTKQFVTPYLQHKKVIFKDSLGIEIQYSIENKYSVNHYTRNQPYSSDCLSQTIYSSTEDNYHTILKDTSNGGIGISYIVDFNIIGDSFQKIEYINFRIDNNLPLVYFKVVNKTLQLNTPNAPEVTLKANGKEYKNAIVSSSRSYFHRQYGLLAFRNSSGTLWVFDRFE